MACPDSEETKLLSFIVHPVVLSTCMSTACRSHGTMENDLSQATPSQQTMLVQNDRELIVWKSIRRLS